MFELCKESWTCMLYVWTLEAQKQTQLTSHGQWIAKTDKNRGCQSSD